MLDMGEMINRLILHEGLKLKPYKDTKGKLTIGIGRCIDTNPFTCEELKAVGDWKNGITRNAAFMLCRNDINKSITNLRKRISFFDRLDKERQYALIDMCYQMGIEGLCQFKKMIAAMGTGNYIEASKHCLDSKYAKQDAPTRAKRIAKLIETGRFIV